VLDHVLLNLGPKTVEEKYMDHLVKRRRLIKTIFLDFMTTVGTRTEASNSGHPILRELALEML
jgi:hypothetical protein